MSRSTGEVAGLVTRTDVTLTADPARVLARLFLPGEELMADGESRAAGVLARILALPADVASSTLRSVQARYEGRHRDLPGVLLAHFDEIAHRLPTGAQVTDEQRSLIGAGFTQEFSVEGAALFNPSAVTHPDQSGLGAGQQRFLLSVRAVGDGCFSCVEFRTGVVGPGHELRMDDPGPHVESGRTTTTPYDRELFGAGPIEEWCSYEVEFSPDSAIAQRVLWPYTPAESRGMEDARFVRFIEEDGTATYRATYTAFDGVAVTPQVIETADFRSFRMSQLVGPAARNKGMALFPRKVGGRYVALSRWDRENNAIATSVDGRWWDHAHTLDAAGQIWELIQTGNCGSPLETAAGWLVLTHGVGPMREYSLGALLLDLEDPTRVIGRLRDPLMSPMQDERNGYVPNVVYSCGALMCGDQLLLPYGVSDSSVRFAFVDLPALLDRLTADASQPETMRPNRSA